MEPGGTCSGFLQAGISPTELLAGITIPEDNNSRAQDNNSRAGNNNSKARDNNSRAQDNNSNQKPLPALALSSFPNKSVLGSAPAVHSRGVGCLQAQGQGSSQLSAALGILSPEFSGMSLVPAKLCWSSLPSFPGMLFPEKSWQGNSRSRRLSFPLQPAGGRS